MMRKYKEANNNIHVSDKLKNATIEKMLHSKEGKSFYAIKKAIFVPIIIAILIIFPALSFAGIIDFGDLYNLYFRVNKASNDYLIQFETKLNGIISISNDIKLELLSTTRDDEKVYLLYSIEDLKKENRLSDITNVNDEFINLVKSGASGNTILDYDKENNKLYLMAYSSGLPAKEEIKFKVNTFDFGKPNIVEVFNENVDMYSILENEPSHNYNIENDIGGFNNLEDGVLKDGMNILKKDVLNIPLKNIDGTKISNIGFVDGCLHIQLKEDEGMDIENKIYSYPYFLKANNQPLIKYSDMQQENIGYVNFEDNSATYYEYIYKDITDITQLKDVKMVYDVFLQKNEYLNFSVLKFESPKNVSSKKLSINRKLNIDGQEILKGDIILSILDLKIVFYKDDFKEFGDLSETEKIYLTYKDGSKYKLNSYGGGISIQKNGSYKNMMTFYKEKFIIEIDKVKSISINDVIYDI